MTNMDNFVNPKADTSEETQHDLIKGLFEFLTGRLWAQIW